MSMTTPRGGRIARLALGLALVAGSQVPAVLAASPSPGSSAEPGGPFPTIEARLDAAIRPDARPGSMIEAGITFWDRQSHTFAAINGVYVLLRPAEGDAEPSVGTAESDFRGHIVAEFAVPEGGPGAIEVGVQGRVCTSDGACTDAKLPFTLAGTGPPPEADPATLIDATFLPFVGDLVANREFPVSVDVVPRGRWDIDALDLPERLVVTATVRGGPELARADLVPGGSPGTPYTGHLTIPEAGDVALAVAVPAEIGEDHVIASSSTGVTVIESGGGGTPAEPADTGEADERVDIPIAVWLIGIGVLVAVGLVARRALADL
jgi:hypothetical protein